MHMHIGVGLYRTTVTDWMGHMGHVFIILVNYEGVNDVITELKKEREPGTRLLKNIL